MGMRFLGLVLAVGSGLLCGSGCAPSVSRVGYVRPTTPRASCAPTTKLHAQLPNATYQVVGRIQIGDSGFSTDCAEEDVQRILHDEACEVFADVIDIEAEHRPDLASTCYRVEARFLRLHDARQKPDPDPRFQSSLVASRTRADDSSQSALIWGAIIAGVVAGVVTGIVVSQH
jgi:hypothetical protein